MIDVQMRRLKAKAEMLSRLYQILMIFESFEDFEQIISFNYFNECLDFCKLEDGDIIKE